MVLKGGFVDVVFLLPSRRSLYLSRGWWRAARAGAAEARAWRGGLRAEETREWRCRHWSGGGGGARAELHRLLADSDQAF
uniref:Uncharacterized protein n=1 Tax=Oryza sativa subsp. japonica TaxID=39947 RepID=Q6K217_ORYSJ|nr:hypothetical protein [Oryza sativa Japonica Group]